MQNRSIPILLCGVLATLLSAPGLWGSSVLEMTPAELVSGASNILVATASGQFTYRDGDNVWTTTTLQVSEVLKGGPVQEYSIRQYGGVIGDIGYAVSGIAPLRVGEKYLLMLDDVPSVTPVRGLFQGLFRVQGTELSDALGRRIYWRGQGVPFGRGDVQPSADTAAPLDRGSTPENFASFRARVLSLVHGSPQPPAAASGSPDSSLIAFADGIPAGDFTLLECVPGSGNPMKGWQNKQYALESLDTITNGGPGTQWLDALNAAIADWNAVSSAFQIGITVGSSSAEGSNDGRNTVGFFSTLRGGEPWPSGVLGINNVRYTIPSCFILEGDVRINSNRPWSSNGSSSGFDFQSVVGHEIGHGFGLDHPNGLTNAAIMLTGILGTGDTMRVQQSDRNGVLYLYGGTGPPAQPDLVVTALQAGTSAAIGGTLPVTQLSVRNDGTAAAGAFRLAVYFSNNATISLSDTYSGFSCSITSLAVGATNTCSGNITVPGSLTAGTYFLGAFADDQGQVAESDETNNTRVADSGTVSLTGDNLPDLVVTSLRAASSSVIGGTLPITELRIQNIGTASAGPFRAGIYYSTDQTITTSDVSSGLSCVFSAGLAAGNTGGCGSGQIPVPSSLSPGTYYFGAIADDLSQVAESNEANDTRIADTGQVTLASGDTPQIAEGGVVSAASFAGPALTPGGIASVFGSRLSNVSGIVGAPAIPLSTSLGGSSVRINGILAPLFAVAVFSGLEQINFQVPWELAGQSVASVVVENNGIASPPLPVNVLTAQPGIFTVDGTAGIFIHAATGALVTSENPAARGETLVMYLTGLGPVTNRPLTGFAAGVPLSQTTTLPIVTIGEVNATVQFSGLTPSLVALYQINLEVPPTAPSGNLDVVVQVAGQASKITKLSVQ